MKFLRLELVTNFDRNLTLSLVPQVISKCGGWIIDHKLFSNISATINFEMLLSSINDFISALEEADYHPRVQGDIPKGDEGDLNASISITFIHSDPDMKRDVPAFG